MEVIEEVIVLVGVDDGVVVVVRLLVMVEVIVDDFVDVGELVAVDDGVLVTVVDCVVDALVVWLDVTVVVAVDVPEVVPVAVCVDVGVVLSHDANVPSINDSMALFKVLTAAPHLFAGEIAMKPPMWRSTANPPSPRVYSSNMASRSCDAAPPGVSSANTCVPSLVLQDKSG